MFFGDEGLLQYLIFELRHRQDRDERWSGILELAERLHYREHFPMIAHAGGPEVAPSAEDKFAQFGSADARRDLERRAAKWVGVDPAWRIVLWVPGPKMRLKLADVLVEDRGMISKLERRNADARQIAVRHEELWTVRVYLDRDIQADTLKLSRIVSFLFDEMKLPFVYNDGRPAVSSNRLAAEDAASKLGLDRSAMSALETMLDQRAVRHENTFDDLLTHAQVIGQSLSPSAVLPGSSSSR